MFASIVEENMFELDIFAVKIGCEMAVKFCFRVA